MSITRFLETRPARTSLDQCEQQTCVPMLRLARFIVRLPAHTLLLLIRIYQRTLSPALPMIFGSTCGCRFAPSCSHYAAGAIQAHGVLVGVTLAAIRLVKCTPLHPGGFDPVPPRRSRPRCERFAA